MTDKVNPSVNRPAEAYTTAGAIAYGGHGEDGFIIDGATPTGIADQDLQINEGNLNSFEETSSSSSLDVTIDAGEAFIFGAWTCIDESTTVTLAANTSTQTVFVGWNKGTSDDVIVGLASAFASNSADTDEKIPLYDFDTDGSGVTNVTDRRRFEQVAADQIEQGPGSGLDADTVDGLEASALGTASVSDDGSTVVSAPEDINFGSSIGVTDDGDDSVTVAVEDDFVLNSGDTMSGALDMGSNKITSLADPTADTDGANKGYVDAVAEGLDVKDSVVICTETNIDLTSTSDPNPVDGITLSDGDRVLLKEQTDDTENGIYVATTATDPSTWVRAPDADEDAEVTSGMFVFIESGNTHANQGFVLITADPITLGTTSLEFVQFSGAGSLDAGDGIEQSGNTLNIVVTDFAGDGVEDDGSNNLRVDEDFDFTFTSTIDFSAGLDTQGDITDGTDVIWDSTNTQIPAVVIQQGSGSNLDADTVDGADLADLSTALTQVQSETGSYTASDGDIVLADASSTTITVTLPSPSSGDIVSIKKTDSSSNAVIIDTPGAETIDGQANLSINSQYSARTIVSDGSDYFII